MSNPDYTPLATFLERIPSIKRPIATGPDGEVNWWVKFRIDIDHRLAWQSVQELGCVINYLSLDERLPTVFYPASPPPYMNGGPEQFLSWVIETRDPEFTPADMAEWLEGRLPRPVEDLEEWVMD